MSTCKIIIISLSSVVAILFVLCCMLMYKLVHLSKIYPGQQQGFRMINPNDPYGQTSSMTDDFHLRGGRWEQPSSRPTSYGARTTC